MKKDCDDLLQYFAHDHLWNQRQDEGFNRLLKIGGENYKNSRSKLVKQSELGTDRIHYLTIFIFFFVQRVATVFLSRFK